MWFYLTVMCPKDAVGMANSVDPEEQPDLGLHCLPRPVCSNAKGLLGYNSLFLFMQQSQDNRLTSKLIKKLFYETKGHF